MVFANSTGNFLTTNYSIGIMIQVITHVIKWVSSIWDTVEIFHDKLINAVYECEREWRFSRSEYVYFKVEWITTVEGTLWITKKYYFI